jgi:DNA polymerase III sliding clamp (beta) subunit (PCNA family)
MQIKVDKKVLMEALTLSKGSVDRDNPTNIVYESVLFTADPGGVLVTATDGAIWSRFLVKAEVLGEAPTLVKSSQLVDIVSGLDDGELEIVHDGHRATLKSGRYRAEFGVANAMEFPAFPKLSGALCPVKAGTLAELIKSVEGSADTKADRPFLCGVNFRALGGDLRAVAADGSRMAVSEAALPVYTAKEGVAAMGTAGTRLARHWASLAGSLDKDQIILFGFQNGWGFCSSGDATIAGVLPDQRFPDWENAEQFPKAQDKRRAARFDRKKLAKAVQRVVAIGARMKIPAAIDLELDEHGTLSLESHASSGKSARDKLEGHVIDKAFPAPVRRRVGGELLRQALNTLKTQEVVVFMTANGKQPVGFSNTWGKIGDVCSIHWLMPRS